VSDGVVWSALAVAICSGIAGIVLVVVRGLEAVRAAKKAGVRITDRLGSVSRKADLATTKLESAGDTRELQESVARLRRSLAQLAILRAAIAEVEKQFAWVRVLR
jgi:hypothetical protein